MGETCERCGRPKGISFNDTDAYKKCLGGAPCLERAYERSQAALAAARREIALYRGVIDNLLSTMEMQEKRESGEFHITGEVMWGIWSDAKSQARAALAAPAAGEETYRCPHGRGSNESCRFCSVTGEPE